MFATDNGEGEIRQMFSQKVCLVALKNDKSVRLNTCSPSGDGTVSRATGRSRKLGTHRISGAGERRREWKTQERNTSRHVTPKR